MSFFRIIWNAKKLSFKQNFIFYTFEIKSEFKNIIFIIISVSY